MPHRPIASIIAAAPRTAETERADWKGESQAAKLRGALAHRPRRAFGQRVTAR